MRPEKIEGMETVAHLGGEGKECFWRGCETRGGRREDDYDRGALTSLCIYVSLNALLSSMQI